MLEPRVARLEEDMKEVKTSLRSIETTLTKIEGRLTEDRRPLDRHALASSAADRVPPLRNWPRLGSYSH